VKSARSRADKVPDVRSDVSSLLRPTASRALVDPDAGWELSGEQVVQRVDGLAAQITAAGVVPGDAVALVLDHGPGAVLAFLAVLRCNATAIPLNPQLHPHEMEALLVSRTPALVVLGQDAGSQGAQAANELRVPAVTLIADRDPRLQDAPPGYIDRLPDPDAEAVALLLHTSGTTGAPKAVPLRQRNLTASARAIARGYGLGGDDVSYCLMPLFHVHGLLASTLAALCAGGAVVVPRRVRPSALWQHGQAHGVTWFSAVPTILAKLPPRPQAEGDRLRFARSCSSALAPSLWAALEQRLGVPIVEAYGMTEASHQMTTNPLPPRERRPGSVGTPAGADVRILGADWEVLPADTAGEVAVHGPGVVDGYLDNDEANAVSFRDGWFRTGDLGRLSTDGYLALEGRLKELINRGGEKIAPREIDEALLAHPAVLEAVAFGRPDPKWGEVVEAVVVLGAPVTSAALREHCSERLAAFKVPRTVHIVEQIPKGATGKIQRRMVAETLTT
jgi:acyl-CoA synthetase (AMP-forming)/AMP-acid ligase II